MQQNVFEYDEMTQTAAMCLICTLSDYTAT